MPLAYAQTEKQWESWDKYLLMLDAFSSILLLRMWCDYATGRSSAHFHAMWIYWSTYSSHSKREERIFPLFIIFFFFSFLFLIFFLFPSLLKKKKKRICVPRGKRWRACVHACKTARAHARGTRVSWNFIKPGGDDKTFFFFFGWSLFSIPLVVRAAIESRIELAQMALFPRFFKKKGKKKKKRMNSPYNKLPPLNYVGTF